VCSRTYSGSEGRRCAGGWAADAGAGAPTGEEGRAATRHLLLPALPVVLLVGVGGDGSALGSCALLKGERRQACRQRRQGGWYPGVLSGARASRGPGPAGGVGSLQTVQQ
jgi:hypothetical protein